MKKFLLAFVFILSIVIMVGCTSSEELFKPGVTIKYLAVEFNEEKGINEEVEKTEDIAMSDLSTARKYTEIKYTIAQREETFIATDMFISFTLSSKKSLIFKVCSNSKTIYSSSIAVVETEEKAFYSVEVDKSDLNLSMKSNTILYLRFENVVDAFSINEFTLADGNAENIEPSELEEELIEGDGE